MRGLQGGNEAQISEKFRGQEDFKLNFRVSVEKRVRWQDDTLVVVDEKTLHDENMDALLLPVGILGFRWQADSMWAGKLDWVLLPAFYSVDHGLHVQGGDHW